MKIEKLRAKLAKYEEAYRAARREYGQALSLEITRMHASDLPEGDIERRPLKSRGGKRRPKAAMRSTSTPSAASGRRPKANSSTTRAASGGNVAPRVSKRGPGRPKMTEAQKAEAREARRQKLLLTSETGSIAAMDDEAPPQVTNWDRAEGAAHA